MSPRTTNQLKVIRKEKRELIIVSALTLFAYNGIHSTSMSEVALKAGISKGLIYNYFKSKEDLIQSIVLKGLNEIIALFDPNKDGILEKQELKFFIDELFKLMDSNREFWKLYFSLMVQPEIGQMADSIALDTFRTVMSELQDYFTREGYTDPEGEMLLFHATMDGIIMNYTMNPEGFPAMKIKKVLYERYKIEDIK